MNITDEWIVGFADGDGCFKIYPTETIRKDGTVTVGKRYVFVISQDVKSEAVLYAIKKRFQCGSVNRSGKNMREYRVTRKEHMQNIILPFFYKNPLRTFKFNDFKILYEDLFQVTLIDPFPKPPINRDWLTGFIDAEANFYVSMTENYPRPHFTIGLHSRDTEIINEIYSFMGCGCIFTGNPRNENGSSYIIYQISDLRCFIKIIKLCTTDTNRCLLKTNKRISFLKFKRIVFIIEQRRHLTEEGILEINKILKSLV